MEYVFIAALIPCYASIIALYAWVTKIKTEIENRMNEHHENSNIHADSNNFMRKDVCGQIVTRIEVSVDGAVKSMEKMERSLTKEFSSIREMIKERDS